jgi:hypothetical protein
MRSISSILAMIAGWLDELSVKARGDRHVLVSLFGPNARQDCFAPDIQEGCSNLIGCNATCLA